MNRHYEYDRNGNVQSISNLPTPTLTPEAMTYSYQNNNNQLTQTINGTNTTFAYNAAGNLITEQKDTTTRTYTYNDSQRLGSVIEDSTTLGQYAYDALGRRTKKVVGETTTLYIYDQNGLLIAEYSGDGTWQKDYVYLNGQPLTMVVANTPESVYYYHNDHLGTPQMMTDSTGTVVWSATYDPFGKATITVEQITNNLRFPGQYYDSETGLYYNYFRDYNSEVGRYIQADPIEIGGKLGLYLYVLNDPINETDRFGLFEDGWKRTGRQESPPGHSDFPGYPTFDWTAEDHDPLTRPENPFTGVSRHFRPMHEIMPEIEQAIKNCDKEKFERLGHQGQDYYSHYQKGYRAPFGHALESLQGCSPDIDIGAWQEARWFTQNILSRWNASCRDKKCK